MSYRPHTQCRICGSTNLIPVFDLGLTPLANNFVKPGEPRQGHYPLKVLFCPKCTLSQLSVVVDPSILYRDYKYVTSTSQVMAQHFDHLVDLLHSEQPIESIVEVGGNDGAFLVQLRERIDCRAVGIDPAHNLRPEAVMWLSDFFNENSAYRSLALVEGNPSVILARHCVAHMDNLHEFVKSLTMLAGPKTVVAIEIPYMRDTLDRVEFDQIYHEHLSFINLQALAVLLLGTPFHIHRVVHYAVHGGTVLILLRHNESGIEPTISEYVRDDKVTLEDWRTFGLRAQKKIEEMRNAVLSHHLTGSVICGFGASAKASVWINACNLHDSEIAFVTDNSPLKPGCLMPGTQIPVVEQSELLTHKIDYACMWAWNFKREILDTQTQWRASGGRFIIPTSTGVEIV